MEPAVKYERLSRNCYLGPDHLLLCARSFFTEQYRRLYFNDIQCVVLQRTGAWHWYTVLFALPLAIVLLIGFSGGFDHSASAVTLLIFLVPLLGGLVVNLVLGPSCRVSIRTAVGTQWAQGREPKSRKIVQRLAAEVTQVQGPMPLDVSGMVQQPPSPPGSPAAALAGMSQSPIDLGLNAVAFGQTQSAGIAETAAPAPAQVSPSPSQEGA